MKLSKTIRLIRGGWKVLVMSFARIELGLIRQIVLLRELREVRAIETK